MATAVPLTIWTGWSSYWKHGLFSFKPNEAKNHSFIDLLRIVAYANAWIAEKVNGRIQIMNIENKLFKKV